MSEKMALNNLREKFTKFLAPFVNKLGFINPNYVSWFSLFIAGISAWCFATATADSEGAKKLILATLLFAFAAFCDALDGQIARVHNKASSYGDFLDHTIDRIVDFGVIVAIGVNTAWLTSPHLGYAAGLATLMGSYMGTQAQSVGLGRNYGGFGRADRMAITFFGCLAAIWQAFNGVEDYGQIPLFNVEINALSIVLLISFIGGIYTFFSRFTTARNELVAMISAPQGGEDSNEEN
ncbi:MAG: CDP-alcohol phosphatidyltransferase family protein [Candidatus Thalassarchaeaceae archaeon]|jgi:archaetidylinositol phosphate synthase|nr:CDP-alcohol phosphatidyltransferase family protein [Candidatus Thalassarchaeaceae archaeon]